MKKEIIFLLLTLYCSLFSQGVVINEVMYDPPGTDSGYEWIELFNNSPNVIDLLDWELQCAGSEFETIFTFPAASVEPYSYLVIGDEHADNVDIYTFLAFQNGGSQTDGIRICNQDSSYTDTVLYDEPNDNNLFDDNAQIANSFAPDVAGGNVLMRYPDGVDTNDSNHDFFESSILSPGSANIVQIDVAISSMRIQNTDNKFHLFTVIQNLSTWDVDNSEVTIDFFLNNCLQNSYLLPEIPAQDSIQFEMDIGYLEDDYYIVENVLTISNDNLLENNRKSESILVGESFVILNEVLFDPDSVNQEWVEIYCRKMVDNNVDNLLVKDAAGGTISFQCNLLADQYFAICEENIALQNYYSLIDTLNIFKAESWTSLNNTEESLYLTDSYGTILDSLIYNGSNCLDNHSIERVNPYSDGSISWKISIAELGATPTKANSVMPLPGDLEITFSNLISSECSLFHELFIQNIGFNPISQFELSLYSVKGGENYEIFILSEEFSLEDSLHIILETDIPEIGYTTYHYELTTENDDDLANNDCYSFYNKNSYPVVINEIMYNPLSEDPEWIEIKFNTTISNAEYFYCVVDGDSIVFTQEFEYTIITNSEKNVEELSVNYNLAENQVLYGSFSLSNSGEILTICNELGNMIEWIDYDPDWNEERKGISIERINPNLFGDTMNWGPSVETSTPGKQNSLFVEILPSKTDITINPNPFSPYRSESTIITIELPETISTITIRIFDLKGREIRKLVNQDLMSHEGSIIWNGKDDNQNCLPIGVYILKLDATSKMTEKTYEKIETVVIGK